MASWDRVWPYLLVVAAAWCGSWLWYEQNEDRREQAIEDITTESYSEDVDSCKRVNYGVRNPLHTFMTDLTDIKELRQAREEESTLWYHAREAQAATSQRDCLEVVGRPEASRPYEPDPGERHGIPIDELDP